MLNQVEQSQAMSLIFYSTHRRSANVHDDDDIHCGAPADYSRPLSRTNRGGVVSVASRIIRQWLVREMALELH